MIESEDRCAPEGIFQCFTQEHHDSPIGFKLFWIFVKLFFIILSLFIFIVFRTFLFLIIAFLFIIFSLFCFVSFSLSCINILSLFLVLFCLWSKITIIHAILKNESILTDSLLCLNIINNSLFHLCSGSLVYGIWWKNSSSQCLSQKWIHF